MNGRIDAPRFFAPVTFFTAEPPWLLRSVDAIGDPVLCSMRIDAALVAGAYKVTFIPFIVGNAAWRGYSR